MSLAGPRVTIKTAFELEEWVRRATPGERVIYHHGHLAADRFGKGRDARRVHQLAAFAHHLGEIDEIEMRPCGHIKSIRPAQHKIRLLSQKDEQAEGSRFYFAELLPQNGEGPR